MRKNFIGLLFLCSAPISLSGMEKKELQEKPSLGKYQPPALNTPKLTKNQEICAIPRGHQQHEDDAPSAHYDQNEALLKFKKAFDFLQEDIALAKIVGDLFLEQVEKTQSFSLQGTQDDTKLSPAEKAAKADSIKENWQQIQQCAARLKNSFKNYIFSDVYNESFKQSILQNKIKTLQGHTDWVRSAHWNKDGSKILSASNDGTIKIWDTKTCESLQSFKCHKEWINWVDWNFDGTKIASVSDDTTIKIWDAQTQQCLHTLNEHIDWANWIHWNSDGDKIASASEDGTIKIWNIQTGKCLKTLKDHTGAVYSAQWSFDGSKIVSASEDGTIKIWNAKTGKCLRTFEGHTKLVNSAYWSFDDSQIVSASEDETIKIWDAQTGECLKTLKGHNCFVSTAIFNPTNSLIASAAGKVIKIWDTATGKCTRTIEDHTDIICSLEWNPSGTKIVSTSKDKTIKIIKILATHPTIIKE